MEIFVPTINLRKYLYNIIYKYLFLKSNKIASTKSCLILQYGDEGDLLQRFYHFINK